MFEKKYGVDSVNKCDWKMEKTKKIIQEKYRCDYVTQTDDFKNKVKETQFKRYGTWYSSTEERNDRIVATCQEKYGVNNVFQTKDVKDKTKETMMNKYGYDK